MSDTIVDGDCREDGNDDDESTKEVRHNGHAYLNYETNVQHTLLTDYVDM